MRVYLDDVRPMPAGFDINPKTAKECIELLQVGKVDFISFDHDLGPPEAGTGYDVALWIEEHAFLGTFGRVDWIIHSANPVGRRNIESAMGSAERFWKD